MSYYTQELISRLAVDFAFIGVGFVAGAIWMMTHRGSKQ